MNTRKFMGIFAIAFAFALAGCQSGGGSTNPTPTTAQSGSGSDGSSTTAAPPASQSGSGGTTVPPANQGGDGTTTSPPPAAAYTVSGTVSGSVIAGVTITATPGGVAAVTDDSGNYVLKNLPAGSYAVTSSYSGVTFTPASKTVTVSNGAVTGVNFSDPLQVLKEDTLLYPCPNAVCQKDLITGDEAVAVTPLATYGQEQPVNVVPFRSGDRIAFVGYNTNGTWVSSLTPGSTPIFAIDGNTNLTADCYSAGDLSSFDVAHTVTDGDIAVVPVECSSPGGGAGVNIFVVKMDGSSYFIRITDDQKISSSPVFAGVNSTTGVLSVLYIISPFVKGAEPGDSSDSVIWRQEVNTMSTPSLVGAPTIFATKVVDDARGLSVNAARTKVAFVRSVRGGHHIFVKGLAKDSAPAVDLGPGDNPYWSLQQIGSSSLILYSKDGQLYAVSPDGTRRFSVPTPSNPWGALVNVVFAPPV
jgi:hypothetical protein